MIAALAEGQHGRVARRQLLGLGLGAGAIDWRVCQGRLRPTRHRGVYAVGHRVSTRKARWMEAVLAAGPGAVLSHRAAGALWRLLRSSRLEVTVSRALRSRGSVMRHTAALLPDEVTEVDGIPVTTVPRTLLDLAGLLGDQDFQRALHEAEYLRLHDHLSLLDLLERHPRRRGARRIRAAIAAWNDGTRVSRREFESRFRALVEQAGLPVPEMNLWVDGREVDALWRRQRLMIELDGWAAHGTRHAYEQDRARDRRFTRDGWRVVRVTWRQLCEEPDALGEDLRVLLRTAVPRR